MAMCVHERDREKVGDKRGERVQNEREKVRKSRGGKESIGWEREEVWQRGNAYIWISDTYTYIQIFNLSI